MNKIKFNKRIVVTCTTLPDRYNSLLKMLYSVQDQDCFVDKIYVTIPIKAKRLNKLYPDIPKKISNIATIIRIKTDYGPLTKLYGALYHETNPDTIIISLDDDCTYDKCLISYLVNLHEKNNNVAICGTGCLLKNGVLFASYHTNSRTNNSFTGFNIPNNGRYIDLIHGYAGVLYKRSFFPNKEYLYKKLFKYPLLDSNVFCHDDIIISGYLNKNNIKMIVYKNIPSHNIADKNEDSLSYHFFEMVFKFKKSITYLKKHGMFLHYESVSYADSPIYKALMIIILIILIIIYYYYFTPQPFHK